MRLIVSIVVSVLFSGVGCSYYWTEGGDRDKRDIPGQDGNPSIDNGSSTKSDHPGSFGPSLLPDMPKPPVIVPNDSEEPTEVSQEAKDRALIQYLSSFSIIREKFSKELRYLANGGFEKLRAKSYVGNGEPHLEMVSSFSSSTSDTTTNAAYGTQGKGSIDLFQKMSEMFCEDFETYRQQVGPEGYENIDKVIIIQYSKNDNRCNFDFYSKNIREKYSILAFDLIPSYYGVSHYFKQNNIFIEISYRVEPAKNTWVPLLWKDVILVKEAKQLTVVVEDGDRVQSYNFKGFSGYSFLETIHKGVVQEFTKGLLDSIKSKARFLERNRGF